MAFVTAVMSFAFDVTAQKFAVGGFRLLPNDVSAFIDPVKDLNGEDCALIKVQADTAFVFTAPLGVVRRVDNVGEIWLYVPRKSKSMTIKHPQWGVLRDYRFPERIDSHLTYEMKIDEPVMAAAQPVEIVTTVRDTVIINHTDTVMVSRHSRRVPLLMQAGATLTYGGRSQTLAPGIMFAVMRRHGALIHVSSDFGRAVSTVGSCDKSGV
ncbi:MAG: hypothetical protein K2K92_06605, partial [Duncaniella sp.]|nr:hypothetical protein [Duncaniella sp.]